MAQACAQGQCGAAANALYSPPVLADDLTSARLRRRGGEVSLVDEHPPKSAEPTAADHCAKARPMIHLMARNVAKIRVERGEAAPSLILCSSRLRGTKRRGPALVLSCGICHVLHRTALLSQLAIHKARSDNPTRRGVGCRWRGRVGRRHGQKAASGRKAARGLPPRRVARPWAQPFSSLSGWRGWRKGGADVDCVGTSMPIVSRLRRGARVRR